MGSILDTLSHVADIAKEQAVKAGFKRPVPNAIPQVSDDSYNLVHGTTPAGTVAGQSPDAATWYGSTPQAEEGYTFTPEAAHAAGYPSYKNGPGFGPESYLAIGEGLIGAAAAGNQIGDIADTSYQQSQINQMGNIGRFNVNSYDQLFNQYGLIDAYQPDLSYDKIRGGSFNERLGSTLSSTVGNAMAGAKINPWRGVAMGAGTLLWDVGNWINGDREAENAQKRLMIDRNIAAGNALQNLEARAENLADYNFRNQVPRVRAEGGNIDRKQTSLKDFADSLTKRAKTNTIHSAGVVREYCNGGVKIRIKR